MPTRTRSLIGILLMLSLFARAQSYSSAPQYNESTNYRLIRNEPAHSGLFGVTVIPIIVGVSPVNVNFSGGVGAFYTFESKVGLSATYQRAYVDDLAGQSRDDIPFGDAESHGIPASYTKTSLLDFQAKVTALSWEKETYYHLHLGRTRFAGHQAEVVGRARGMVMNAITARIGYQVDNRLVESSSGKIDFVNSTPVYDYHWQGQVYPLTPVNLATSSTTVNGGVITAGLGYTSFRDMKIDLEDDTYTGKREEKEQIDLFADVLYAQSMTVEDMIYYHALEPVTGEYTHLPQRLDLSHTPVNKMGFRVGLQTLSMASHFGWRTQLELGQRPGPKLLGNQGIYLQLTIGMVFGGRLSFQ